MSKHFVYVAFQKASGRVCQRRVPINASTLHSAVDIATTIFTVLNRFSKVSRSEDQETSEDITLEEAIIWVLTDGEE